jgi:hypothetical protein
VPGAGHVDLWRKDDTLRSALAGFLANLPQ